MHRRKSTILSQSGTANKFSRKIHHASSQATPILTCGEVFSDGTVIEPIQDAVTGRLCLLVAEQHSRRIASAVEFRDRVYRPAEIDPSILLAMKFPTRWDQCGSTRELFTDVRETFVGRGFPEDVALPSTFFAFATWFTDSLPAAPFLPISGPPAEARFLQDLLGCFVRHPLRLCEVSRRALCSLPMDLRPTLLVSHEPISPAACKLLRASNDRSAYVPQKNGLVNICCSKAVYVGETEGRDDFGESVLRINLLPSHGRLPLLDPDDEQKISAKFQAKFVDYRCSKVVKVRDSKCDFAQFDSGIRILGRILGVALDDDPELNADLTSLLGEVQERTRASQWLDLDCVTVEAVLFYCHEKPGGKAHVGEVTRTVNSILKGRGESAEFEPEVIGHILRRHGFCPKRDGKGYYIMLDDRTRRHAHLVALRRDVAAVQVGIEKCAHCSEMLKAEEATPDRGNEEQ